MKSKKSEKGKKVFDKIIKIKIAEFCAKLGDLCSTKLNKVVSCCTIQLMHYKVKSD